ncbi:hypothetical protein Z043_111482, partial [Scleropages formosus]
AGDLTGNPFGYVTGVLAVIIHASYLVLIQKTSADSDYGPLTAQYAIAITATPVLLICSFISMDAIEMWSYSGWANPYVTCLFIASIFIGGAMNFTTLHCTYINSAVTTSFVGVVKSIVTITVGMLAFSDVDPTNLFVAGVVVNTVGSVTYCVVKYFETKKKSSYQDLEEASKDQELPGQPYTEEKSPNGDTGTSLTGPLGGTVDVSSQSEHPVTKNSKSEFIELHKEVSQAKNETDGSSLSDSYVGVWRSVRNAKFLKKDTLIDNEELQSP